MNESTLVPREEISGLDWLARNVHVWPSVTPKIYPAGCKEFTNGAIFHDEYMILDHDIEITKCQWLARRAELQNKPDWSKAEEWAEWLAQDSYGCWGFFQKKPLMHALSWIARSGYYQIHSPGNLLLGDWRDTLENRPEQTIADICHEVTDENRHGEIFEPFVSLEDAKLTIMQSDGDVKHFGGIIGRSLPLEEDAATAKQPVPKGSGSPILGMVLADLTNRALEGKEKYGEPLLAHNGRNPLWDAYQEALDLAMYLRQAIEEQK